MHEEQGIDVRAGHRGEVGEAHHENLDLGDFGFIKIAQADAGAHNGDEQPERKIVVKQGEVAQALIENAPGQQKEQGDQRQAAGPEKARRAYLHDAVDGFQKGDAGRHRLHEEAEVPDKDQQEAVVEKQGKNPQPFGGIVDAARPVADGVAFAHVGQAVAEKGTEEKDFQKHALDDAPGGAGTVDLVLLDEIKRLLLSTGGGDAEGHGRFGPVRHAPDHADDEYDCRHIRQRHAEQRGEPRARSHPGDGSYEQHQQ